MFLVVGPAVMRDFFFILRNDAREQGRNGLLRCGTQEGISRNCFILRNATTQH